MSLENDLLKASLGPDFRITVQLLPTSQYEFYVKEVNVFLAFKKGEATDEYVMLVYENGQEYISKKIK